MKRLKKNMWVYHIEFGRNRSDNSGFVSYERTDEHDERNS